MSTTRPVMHTTGFPGLPFNVCFLAKPASQYITPRLFLANGSLVEQLELKFSLTTLTKVFGAVTMHHQAYRA